jgi:threonylcarbamoyladenosine tRNA methylthiotransferase MtaB
VPSFYIENFGCRATQADGAAIERQFRDCGLSRAKAPTQATLVILNTCTVTGSADQDARAAIRRIHRENPGCQIVVTGCYAQRAPQEISALPGVTEVVGNSHKHRLAEIVLRERSSAFVPLSSLGAESFAADPGQIFVSDIFAHTELMAAAVFEGEAAGDGRTRPNLKVQDGCDNRCSFCVIPSVRGQSRSLPLAGVIREVNALVESGYREVVISGINLGRWGRDFPSAAEADHLSSPAGTTNVVPFPISSPRTFSNQRTIADRQSLRFEDLVRAILAETSLEKLRLSSVEPMDWSAELIGMMAESPRIAKHAHVPMQSGSDRILRLMHRKYRPWHYREKIERIRTAMPTAAIGADVMAGFPGETDSDFEETRGMIEELPFTYLHVFTYSSRPGTPSARMSGQVPVQVARERNRVLRELAAKKKQAFMQGFVGKTIEAITLAGSFSPPLAEPWTEALTDNYLKLRLKGSFDSNRWVTARVEGMEDGTLCGVAISDDHS